MAARWIAAALALITFSIAGFFVVVALRPPAAPTGAGEISTVIRMKSRPWTVAAQLAAFPVGVETTISISDQTGELPAQLQRPTAELRMLDMAMAAVAVSLDEQTTGIWRGLTRLPMPGTWSFVVKLNGEEMAFPISVPAEER